MSRKSKSKDQTQALNIPFTLTQGDLLQEALAVTFAKDQTQALNIPFTLTQGDLLQEALAVTFAKDQTQAFEHSGQSTPRRWTIRRTHRMEWQ
jgi:hypothetical protein